MNNLRTIATGVFGFAMLVFPLAASALTLSVDSLSPGTSVLAKNDVTFNITSSVLSPLTYQVSDSFANSSVSLSNINPAGKFSWNPGISDIGTHTFTITGTSYADGTVDSATVTQTVTVLPPPSISIQSVTPGNKVMPGTTVSFTVSQSGFTNPTYSAGDSFSGSSVGNVTIGSPGNFSWTPGNLDMGEHTITVYANDSLGHSNVASVHITVGVGKTLTITSVPSGTTVNPGQAVSFIVSPMNFSPTGFSVTDNFAGVSTVTNNNITTSGSFMWTPQSSDAGTHVLTIKGIVGAFGDSATTSQTIIVLGPGGIPVSPPSATTATVPSGPTSSDALSALKAQLDLLNSKIAAQSGGTTPPASSAGATFTTYLHPGSDGDEVTRLQNILSQLGFFTATPNGHYGPATVTAVQKFQAAHGLDQLGVVGPATRTALNTLPSSAPASSATPAASSGNSYVFKNFMGFGEDATDGTDVLELQKRLISLGLLSGDATGYFGNMTVAAVKKFQTSHSIAVTGFVGSLTLAALNQ